MTIAGAIGKLKGLIMEPEPVPTADAVHTAEGGTEHAPRDGDEPSGVTAPPVVQSTGSGLDVAQVEKRIDSLIQKDAAFAPFATFYRMSQNMQANIPDEAQRFQAVRSGTEASLDALLAAVNSHSAVLEHETQKFQREVVVPAEQQIADLERQEKDVGEQISQLSAEIARLSAQREELSSRAIAERASLDKQKIDFGTVLTTLTKRYTSLSHKLTEYLGGGKNAQ